MPFDPDDLFGDLQAAAPEAAPPPPPPASSYDPDNLFSGMEAPTPGMLSADHPNDPQAGTKGFAVDPDPGFEERNAPLPEGVSALAWAMNRNKPPEPPPTPEDTSAAIYGKRNVSQRTPRIAEKESPGGFPVDRGPFLNAAIRGGGKTNLEGLAYSARALSDTMGGNEQLDALYNSIMNRADELGERIKDDKIGGFTDEAMKAWGSGDYSGLWKWAQSAAGEGIGSSAGTIGGALAGGAVGGGPGAFFGGVIGSQSQSVGQMNQALEDEGLYDRPLRGKLSLIGGQALAFFDSAFPEKVASRVLGHEAKRQFARGIARRLIEGGLKGAAWEGMTEALQDTTSTLISKAATGHDVDWYEVGKQAVDSAAGGALPGAVIGGGVEAATPDRTEVLDATGQPMAPGAPQPPPGPAQPIPPTSAPPPPAAPPAAPSPLTSMEFPNTGQTMGGGVNVTLPPDLDANRSIVMQMGIPDEAIDGMSPEELFDTAQRGLESGLKPIPAPPPGPEAPITVEPRTPPELREAPVAPPEAPIAPPEAPIAPPPPPTGTRMAPAKTDDELVAGRDIVQEPTPGQAEAGNYQKLHYKGIPGLPVTIETPAGHMRRSKPGDPNGPWESEAPVDYGYVKRSKGADDEHVDIMLGAGDRFFIQNQHDPDSGDFDEHKIVRAPDMETAKTIYDSFYSDGRAPERRGALTEVSLPDLKDWLSGDTKEPVFHADQLFEDMNPNDYVEPTPAPSAVPDQDLSDIFDQELGKTAEAPATAEAPVEPASVSEEPQATAPPTWKEYLAGKEPIDPERIAKRLGITEKEASTLITNTLGGRASPLRQVGVYAKDPKTKRRSLVGSKVTRKPQLKGPRSLLRFLMEEGGLADNPELRRMDAHKHAIPGLGSLVRVNGGLSLEDAMERAIRAGYIQDREKPGQPAVMTPDEDLMPLIRDELAGKKKLTEEGAVESDEQAAEAANAEVEHNLQEALKRNDMTEADWTPADLDRARAAIAGGRDPDYALEDLVEKDTDVALEATAELIDGDQELMGDYEAIYEGEETGPRDEIPLNTAPRDGEEAPEGTEAPQEPVGQGQAPERGQAAEEGGTPDREGGKPKPTEEVGAEGKPQTVLPGAEKAPDAKLAQIKADAPLKPTAPQNLSMEEGLFGEGKLPPDLFDKPAKQPSNDELSEIFDEELVKSPEPKSGESTITPSVIEPQPDLMAEDRAATDRQQWRQEAAGRIQAWINQGRPVHVRTSYKATTLHRKVGSKVRATEGGVQFAPNSDNKWVNLVDYQVQAMLDEIAQASGKNLKPAAGQERTTGEVATSAATNVVKGIDAAFDAATKLFGADPKRLGSSPGFDPDTYEQAKPIFRAAVAHFKEAASDIRELLRRMVQYFKAKGMPISQLEAMKPYVIQYIRDVESGKEDISALGSGQDLERDRGDTETQDQVGEPSVPPAPGPDEPGAGQGTDQARAPRGRPGRNRVPSRNALAVGGGRDRTVPDDTPGPERSPNPTEQPGGSSEGSEARPSADGSPEPEALPDTTAPPGVAERRELQKKAPKTGSVAETLPMLTGEQQDDVRRIEERFEKGAQPGMLITNGTGTGKTFTGLGAIKRMVNKGKKRVLTITPSQPINRDWVKAATNLDLDFKVLDGIEDPGGDGQSVTTFANLGSNRTLADGDWDLIVVDESHNLTQGEKATPTAALAALRALSLHPDGLRERARMVFRKEWAAVEAESNQPRGAQDPVKLKKAWDAFNAKAAPAIEKWEKQPRPKVLFQSATPFAYHFSLDYAEGYLFDFPPKDESGGYNAPSGRDSFYMQNFGYRKRYGKLTKPEADVRSEVMEREYHERLRREGSLWGRVLEDVDHDYDRKFVLVENALGKRIDELLEFLRDSEDGRFQPIHDLVIKKFDFLSRQRLLEAIKAQEVIKLIPRQRALGRKIVVFHDFNEGAGFNPFELEIDPEQEVTTSKYVNGKVETYTYKPAELYQEFLDKNQDARVLQFKEFPNPIQAITKAFPEAMVYNGTISNNAKMQAKQDFNDDTKPEKDIIIIQAAAGEAGISLHDTTGKNQRVEYNLGMPSRPTRAIQQEGRIRRLGQKSNAMFRYLNTGTAWERSAFAQKIAERAGTAENLAMGNQARALRQAFIDGFTEADDFPPGHEGEGTGGKVRDAAVHQGISEFDRAITHYHAQQKGRKNNLGVDYFATPEPLGYKMVQWAGVRPGEKIMEPSAGHGAIARYFPEDTTRHLVEPSANLGTRAALVSPGSKLIQDRFENHNLVNKYHAIVMNPPFGTGGKTAAEHILKATKHLAEGGRLVAIYPMGPMADKRMEELRDSKDFKDIYMLSEIALPDVTFERAGTKARAKVFIFEKHAKLEDAPQPRSFNISDAQDISDMFELLRPMEMPARTKLVELVDPAAETSLTIDDVEWKLKTQADWFIARPIDQLGPSRFAAAKALAKTKNGSYIKNSGFEFPTPEDRQAFIDELKAPKPITPAPGQAHRPGETFNWKLGKTKHTKTGADLYVATFPVKVADHIYTSTKAKATANGGWYSSWRGPGAIPGFQFPTEAQRQKFIEDTGDWTGSAPPASAPARATDTPQFKKWFGSSVVKDENGQPKRMYHGSIRWDKEDGRSLGNFDIFNRRASVELVGREASFDTVGSWFSDSTDMKEGSGMYAGEEGIIYPVYLAISNPRVTTFQAMLDQIWELGGKPMQKFNPERKKSNEKGVEAYRAWLKKNGYDGIHIVDTKEREFKHQEVWIALEPTQIKSATGNIGDFDPSNPSIIAQADTKKQEATSGEWATILRRSPDISAEELADSGLMAWLRSQGRSVTRDEIAQFLEDGAARQGTGKVGGPRIFTLQELVEKIGEIQARIFGDKAGPNVSTQLHVTLKHNDQGQVLMGLRSLIKIASHGRSVAAMLDTYRHEAFHVVRELGLITPQEWAKLKRRALAEWMDRYDIHERYYDRYREAFPHLSEAELEDFMAEEAVAEALADRSVWRKGDLLTQIGEFFEAFANWLRGQGFESTAQALRAFDAGRAAQREITLGTRGYSLHAPVYQAQLAKQPVGPRRPSTFIEPTRTPTYRASLTVAQREIMDRSRRWTQRLSRALNAVYDPIRQEVQDRAIRLTRTQAAIREQGGVIPDYQDTDVAYSLYKGRVADKMERFEDETLKPLIDRINALNVSLQDLDLYLYARHAPERNAWIAQINPKFPDAGSGMSDADAAAVMAGFGAHAAVLDQAAQLVDKLNHQTRVLQRRAGLISQATFDNWENDYAFYVPLRGWEDVFMDPHRDHPDMPNIGNRFSVRGKEAQAALGRSTTADSPLTYSIYQAQQAIVRAEKNRVAQTLLTLVQNHPNENLWKVNKADIVRKRDPQTGQVVENWVQDRASDNLIGVKQGGVQYLITIHDTDLARALRDLDGDKVGFFVRNVLKFQRLLAGLITAYSPEFVLTNFARDLQTAGLQLNDSIASTFKLQVFKDVRKAMYGIYKAIGDPSSNSPWAVHYREFKAAGAQTGWLDFKSIEQEKRRVDALMNRLNPTMLTRVRMTGEVVFGYIERLNTMAENAIRLSVYVNAKRNGFSKDQSARAAREVTVDFNRMGHKGPWLNAWTMFFGAGMQGITRTTTGLVRSKKIRQMALLLVGIGIVNDIVNKMMGGDDDDDEDYWDKLLKGRNWEIERNLVIMTPTKMGDYVKVPASYGFNVFPYMGVQISAAMRGVIDPWTAAKNVVASVLHAWDPMGGGASSLASWISPTLADPVIDIAQNQDWSGRPIYPERREWEAGKPNSQLAYRSVGSNFKWAAEELNELTGGSAGRSGAIDISPEWIEHVVDSIIGSAGQTVTKTVDVAKKLMRGEPIEPYQIPFVRKFWGRAHSDIADTDAYYKLTYAIEAAHNEQKTLKASGDSEGMVAAREKYSVELSMYSFHQAKENQLRQLRKQRNAIEARTDMTAAQKAESVAAKNERIHEIQASVRRTYNARVRAKAAGSTAEPIVPPRPPVPLSSIEFPNL